ncbi:hypothetical protein M501DRAFT_967958 [Patellaria atrata CBS 101060]|uniref:Uncharacterized protein n=1 Tax=Patellaria atrata CBS 101060 TaxID=1346257 RepID=A0A9P4VTV7_9PEZI|nr:hypothetical protein M501DRAFT_967958 [Patellaria atrata CBS 101060]
MATASPAVIELSPAQVPAVAASRRKPKVTASEGTVKYLTQRRVAGINTAAGQATESIEGLKNPDFLAVGLGGTNLLAMLYAVALGRRAVGVELRGDPFLGVHWNIREDLYHQLGLIDQLMMARYGEAAIPKKLDGSLFKLADVFFHVDTVAGDIVPDEIIDGYDKEQHLVGTIHDVEYIDDRWANGKPSRTITLLNPPLPPSKPDPAKIRTNMYDVLDGPSTFQTAASAIQVLFRRYLEKMEEMDIKDGRVPRARLFTHHRVVEEENDGWIKQPDGRFQVRIEEILEMDFKGKLVRLRTPGSNIIDLGVPELFCIAQGFHSSDGERLGFEQKDVQVDHNDGRGPVTAQADFIAGLIEILVDGRLRRRIASEFDKEGNEFWVRQIAVGHENDPEIGWVLVQVPDYLSFDPIEAGLLPEGTDKNSAEYFSNYQLLLHDFYIEQASLVLGIDQSELRKVQMIYGPKLFSLVERQGEDPRVAPNGVIAGDSFGNGHFLTSAGAMTGMIGHSYRFLEYWQRRNEGHDVESSTRLLADRIKVDTEAWLSVSAKEFTEAIPINFGAERGEQIAKASGIDPTKHAHSINSNARERHSLLPLDPSDWRRLFLRNGRVWSAKLPPLSEEHPSLAEWEKVNQKIKEEAAAEESMMMAAATTAPATKSEPILVPALDANGHLVMRPIS